MANLFEQGGLALSSKFGVNGLTFITGYKYVESMLKAINGMTFFYDANWDGNTKRRTFPLAFFHLKGIHEVMDSEVQTKRMLFYNSQSGTNKDVQMSSLLNVVADNIVNKPKTYKLDVIVPYDSLTLIFNSTALSSYQIQGAMGMLTDGSTVTNLVDSKTTGVVTTVATGDVAQGASTELLQNLMTACVPYVTIMKELISGLLNIGGFTATDWLTSMLSTPSYNKDSLEAMWKNRTILKLKLWNGWQFKYVAITSIDITKESLEHGVEEATITCTEIPIMEMHNKKDLASFTRAKSSWLLTGDNLKKGAEAVGAGIKSVAKSIADANINTAEDRWWERPPHAEEEE